MRVVSAGPCLQSVVGGGFVVTPLNQPHISESTFSLYVWFQFGLILSGARFGIFFSFLISQVMTGNLVDYHKDP